MDLQLINCERYSCQQRFVQTTQCSFLGLNVSGLNYMRVYAPDDKPVGEARNDCLFLFPPRFRLDFEYGPLRENYTALCNIEALRWDPDKREAELALRPHRITVPLVLPISPAQTGEMRKRFQRICALSDSAFPADKQIAELFLESIIAEFAETARRQITPKIPEVAERLKQRIDEDREFRHSLKEIMADLPVTEVHLRRLFLKYYRIHPAEYRAELRFNRIRDLLRDPDLTLKEIAELVGMNHVTHLNLFVRKHCGLTPVRLRRSLRI